MSAFANDSQRIAKAREMRCAGHSLREVRRVVGGGSVAVHAAVADIEVPRRTTYLHPEHVRRAAVAAYGKRSMSLVAADLGVSTGAVSHWWAAAKRDGIVHSLFGRHDGSKFHSGRQSRGRGIATYDGERVETLPHRHSSAAKAVSAAPPRAPAGRGEGCL